MPASTSVFYNASCPASAKRDIRLDLEGWHLTIAAQRSESEGGQGCRRASYIRRERCYGTFSRSFDVTGIDESGITAYL